MTSATTPTKISRKRKLVRLDLQLKVVFITLFVTSLVLLINFQLNLASLWSLESRFGDMYDASNLLDAFRRTTIQKFLVSVGMAVPLAASVGILYSFKFCGPIFRFKRYFSELRSGSWCTPLTLRKGDDLQDVCEAINGAMETVRARARQDHEFFQAVRDHLDAQGEPASDDERSRVERLRAMIEDEERSFAQRFGSDPAWGAGAPEGAESSPAATADGDDGSAEKDSETETASASA